MKKFLTVLLALSVVFTYSFSAVGAVFAADATDTQKASLLLEAKENAEKAVNTCYDEAIKTVKAKQFASYTADAEDYANAWKTIDAKARVLAAIEEKYNAEVSGNFGNYPTDTPTAEDYATAVFGIKYVTDETLSALTTKVVDYIWDVVKWDVLNNLYAADRDEAVSALKSIDWSLYSNTKTNANGQTYLAEAQEKVAAAEEYLKDYNVFTIEDIKAMSNPAGDLKTAINAVNDVVENGTAVDGFDGVTATYYDEASNPPQYPTGMYKVNGVDTIKDLNDSEITDAATAAQVKATAQQAYAEYVIKSGADKEFAEAYVKVVSYLADAGEVKSLVKQNLGDTSVFTETVRNLYKDAVKNVAAMESFAAKYKAEKDSEGNLVRDGKAVDKLVEDYTTAEYKFAAGITGATQPSKTDCESDIINKTILKTEEGLAFHKEVAKKALADAKDAIIDDYYPLEAAKVEANYAKVLDKIEAATDENKIPASTTFDAALKAGANTKSVVDGKVSYNAGTAAKADLDAVVAYAKYANSGKNPLADDYIVWNEKDIKDLLNTFYGEQGARTNAEIAALNVDAAAIAAKLPTVGGLAAAKKAAEDAIAALPAKITTADKDAVVAAWEAKEAYVEMGGKAADLKDNADGTLTKAINALKGAMKTELAIEGIKVDKTDKAALNELIAKIDEANKMFGDDAIFGAAGPANPDFTNNDLKDAMDKIREAELANVKKLINAIPVNVTEADRATVEAARKAYDAFVEEWTSYDDPAYYAAGAVTNFRVLALAEAALGLNEDPAKDVESLKITVSTKLYKGSKIRVKWTVKGDASNIDGYQVYKSTKAQKGYKFMGKTKKSYMDNKKNLKKGTRYFYKVRAYKVVDGVKYYSDWSNKGNRIYKK